MQFENQPGQMWYFQAPIYAKSHVCSTRANKVSDEDLCNGPSLYSMNFVYIVDAV